ncbi:MAG TPA: tRNA epoxyqueuosine(34) reductase QueG, partial [Longimicrobiales bacterium]
MHAETTLSERIKERARALGFDLVGIAPVRESDHGEFYRRWLAAGRHGEMAYLAREDAVARRLDPRSAWPALRSAVVVGRNYFRDGAGAAGDPSRGIIARYARGRDYHKVMKKALLALLRWIEAEVGTTLPAARAYVDTGPVLERELAMRAGSGWFGRNTMLIHPRRGSYFFLGTLLLELELEYDAPFEADRCGTCSACVDACPTGALLGRDADGAPVIDATRCISYLTIESRGPIPRELRPAIGNRVFGCDIC